MNTSLDLLSSPTTLGAVSLQNRVVMAPMTRSRATSDNVPTPIMAEYYAQRATAGLLITEGTAPDANGTGYPNIPGIWSDAQVDGWRAVTDAVHAAGGRIAVQLMHTGRVGHPLNLPAGAELLAPSAVAAPGEMFTAEGPKAHPTPRAMTEAEIEEAIEGFVTAAKNARAAGFDLVELHGANGYLIEQFIAPNTNQREDAWGGTVEKRLRFPLEVARRVADAIGADRVGIRLSPHGVVNAIEPSPTAPADYATLAAELGKLGLAYVHVLDHSSMGTPPVPAETIRGIREAFGGPVILAGGYDAARAEADLVEGVGQAIAFGRPFIANPDLVRRLQEGAELATPDHATFYAGGEAGYLDYPTLDA